jgi:uncharacterized protein (TIGR03905 family)
MEFEYRPRRVCPSKIEFELDGGIVKNVRFTGGCDGNLKIISKLIEGMPAREVIETCEGNTCGRKPTSCADQLAKAVEQALEESGKNNVNDLAAAK